MEWILFPSLAVMLASALMTGGVLVWLRHRQILDRPNERSSHSIPTPRGGGLAVVPVILIAWFACNIRAPEAGFWLAAGGAIVVAVVSWLDDLKGLSPAIRFAIQLFCAGLAVGWAAGDGLVFQGILPYAADRLLAVLCWVAFVNFFNFMDGIDGITGVETMVVGCGLALLALLFPAVGIKAFLPLSIAAAGLGFLFWNWHPAKIFMGDIGSVAIGFLLGGLLVRLAAEGHLTAALILPLYYLADAGSTLVMRALRREKIWQAHRQHAYQAAVRNGRSHAVVSASVALCGVLLIPLAVWSMSDPVPALAISFAVVGALIFWMRR